MSIGQNILRAFLGAVSDRQPWQIVCKHGSCFGSSIYSSLQTGHDVLSLDGRLSLFAFWKKAMVTKSLSVRFEQNKLLSKRLERKCEIAIKQSSTVLSNQEELFRIIENHFLSDCAVQSQSTYSLCFCSKIRLTSMTFWARKPTAKKRKNYPFSSVVKLFHVFEGLLPFFGAKVNEKENRTTENDSLQSWRISLAVTCNQSRIKTGNILMTSCAFFDQTVFSIIVIYKPKHTFHK